LVLPALWEQSTFVEKAGGSEILEQMWAFADKGGREVCLIPEATGVVQELWDEGFFKDGSGATRGAKIFYEQRCYRYERPQKGRYREFTQFGVEILGAKDPAQARAEALALMARCLDEAGVRWELEPSVRRGLTYYVEAGFEAIAPQLGAQKQVAGGGAYKQGVGFAIGLDRVAIAIEEDEASALAQGRPAS
jgi:histidyl-tRNA synthetase